MKTKAFSRLIVMVLCAVILVASIGLYAASSDEEIREKCENYCGEQYPGDYLEPERKACIKGCIFGSNL